MSKIALLSDIHANLPALEAVMEKLEAEEPDEWICLGDLVGYGPHPTECIKIVREKKMKCVLGNHDAGVCGRLSINHFRKPNRELIEKTAAMLSKDDLDWLRSLPLTLESEVPLWTAAHASPEQPEDWMYLESAFKVRELLRDTLHTYIFTGHTHRPALVSDKIGLKELKKGHKYMINPGSIGQSRDGDYRASAGVLDTDAGNYSNIRVTFDLERVVSDLHKLGFSRRAAEHMMRI